jgi:hypothetical protein
MRLTSSAHEAKSYRDRDGSSVKCRWRPNSRYRSCGQ